MNRNVLFSLFSQAKINLSTIQISKKLCADISCTQSKPFLSVAMKAVHWESTKLLVLRMTSKNQKTYFTIFGQQGPLEMVAETLILTVSSSTKLKLTHLIFGRNCEFKKMVDVTMFHSPLISLAGGGHQDKPCTQALISSTAHKSKEGILQFYNILQHEDGADCLTKF